jgi:glycerol-3-phosphate acyltransferase PlsX
MAGQVPGFVGNVEGRDLPAGTVDVVVTDGFTGNVALKLLEGTSKSLLEQVKVAMTSSALTSLAAMVLKPGLVELKERLDPEAYGGAPLLGVEGVCIIGHGSSQARGVASAIGVASRAVRAGLTTMIAQAVAAE